MTRTIIYTFVFILFWSCNQNKENKKIEENTTKDTTNTTVEPLEDKDQSLDEYKKYIEKLDSSDIQSLTKSVIKYKELFDGKSDSLCDLGFVIFNNFYESLHKNFNEIHLNDTTDFSPLLEHFYDTDKPVIIPKKLKDYDQKLKNNGFQLTIDDGITYIEKDRDFITKHFYPFVSKTMRNYLTQINKEDKEGFIIDAGLIISPVKLAERIIWYEDFLTNNPKFIFKSECHKNKKNYLTFLLTGMDNTPVYDKETQKISQDYLKAYEYIISTYPNTEAAKMIQPYYNALKKNDLKKTEKLLDQYRKKNLLSDFK